MTGSKDTGADLLFGSFRGALLDLVLGQLGAADASASIHLLLSIHFTGGLGHGLARRLALLRGRLRGAAGRRLLCRLLRLFFGLLLPHRDEFVQGHVDLLLDVRHRGASIAAKRPVGLCRSAGQSGRIRSARLRLKLCRCVASDAAAALTSHRGLLTSH